MKFYGGHYAERYMSSTLPQPVRRYCVHPHLSAEDTQQHFVLQEFAVSSSLSRSAQDLDSSRTTEAEVFGWDTGVYWGCIV